LEGSGIYSSATRLAKALSNYGYNVTINSRRSAEILHFHTALPQSFLKAYLIRVQRNRRSAGGKKRPVIVIHGHTTIEDFVNSFLFSNQLRPFLKWYLPRYYGLADRLIAVSEHNKRLLVNYGIEGKKINVISNGIRLTSAKKSLLLRKNAREVLGLNNGSRLIIGLGISIFRKGIDLFVDIARQMPEFRFIWIGKRISPAFLAKSSYLKGKFIEAKRLKNCQFTGYVSSNTLYGLLNAADLFLYPTREENQGIAFLEATIYGKPAVISNHPVFDEFKDGVHCLKANTVEEYVQQIHRLFGENLTDLLVKNAQEQLLKHDLELSVAKIADLYVDLLKEISPQSSDY